MKKIVILTELGKKIGLGHFVRCSSLCNVSLKFNCNVEMIIYSPDYEFFGEYKCIDWKDEVVLNKLIDNNTYVIIDSYLAPKKIYDYISKICFRLMCFDDYNRIEYPENSIVLNPMDFSNKRDNYLTGMNYVILRECFEKKYLRKINKEVRNVMIILGGTDAMNINSKITKILCMANSNIIFNVINPSVSFDKFKNVKCYYNLDGESMRNLMKKCDIAISASGQTLYELINMQLPTILFKIAENQTDNIIFATTYCGFVLSNLENLSSDFNNMLDFSVRTKISKKCVGIVDGLGAKRIIKKLIEE